MTSSSAIVKFTNLLTKDGKKTKAARIVHKVFSTLNNHHNGFVVFTQALENIKPSFELKKFRIAGTTQQVPALVETNRQESIALRWLIQSARNVKKRQKKRSFDSILAHHIVEAFFRQGDAFAKRQEIHKLAEANRAFAHYRWW